MAATRLLKLNRNDYYKMLQQTVNVLDEDYINWINAPKIMLAMKILTALHACDVQPSI